MLDFVIKTGEKYHPQKKVDEIEELKEEVDRIEFQSNKTLEDPLLVVNTFAYI